jgi:hypothetical protein
VPKADERSSNRPAQRLDVFESIAKQHIGFERTDVDGRARRARRTRIVVGDDSERATLHSPADCGTTNSRPRLIQAGRVAHGDKAPCRSASAM